MTIPAWSGPELVAAALLVLAGVTKVIDPADTARALRQTGLGAPVAVVRLGAAAEVGVGAWALALGGSWPALLVATSYAAFAAFVLVARSRGGAVSSCGCFGKADTPPTLTHVAVNVALALAAVSASSGGSPGFMAVVRHQPLGGLPLLALGAVLAWLVWLAFTALPQLTPAAIRQSSVASVATSGRAGGPR